MSDNEAYSSGASTHAEENELEEDEDMFKILIASDIHLGYNEKDVIRGQDSFEAFEEILISARENKVDFVLLGGDLFHDANPSIHTLNECVRLLRNYTLGDEPIKFEFLSNQKDNFRESLLETVNYEDPNLNVALPIFSIHGNHDDPAGFNRMSSLDILSTTGLINYFGRWTDLTKVELTPIVLKKGSNHLAIYGLSYIHDPRLVRLFNDSKVVMQVPDTKSKLFNIMVVHQNRADRGPKNYLPENVLPGFLDLVVWGHEHECEIELNRRPKGFFICQPGSSVATSLSQGESKEKACGVLLVKGDECKMVPIRLKTVRPFVFRSIVLSKYNLVDEGDIQEKVMQVCDEEIAKMLEEAKEKSTNDKLPLLRLRVEPTCETQMFNPVRFGQKYTKVCANALEIILFSKISRRTGDKKNDNFDKEQLQEAFEKHNLNKVNVEEIADKYFDEMKDSGSDKQLEIFSSKSLSELVRRLVQHDDDDAADKILEFYKEETCKFLNDHSSEGGTEELLSMYRDKGDTTYDSMLKMLDNRKNTLVEKRSRPTLQKDDSDEENMVIDVDDDDDSNSSNSTTTSRSNGTMFLQPPTADTKPKTGKGSRGGRGSRGGSTTTRASRSTANTSQAAANRTSSRKKPLF